MVIAVRVGKYTLSSDHIIQVKLPFNNLFSPFQEKNPMDCFFSMSLLHNHKCMHMPDHHVGHLRWSSIRAACELAKPMDGA